MIMIMIMIIINDFIFLNNPVLLMYRKSPGSTE